jgi:hypothetical protein
MWRLDNEKCKAKCGRRHRMYVAISNKLNSRLIPLVKVYLYFDLRLIPLVKVAQLVGRSVK